MAKRKRRKSAGPPPVRNPKRTALEASGEAPKKDAEPKRRQGEPAPPSFRGVALRAAIVAVIFYPYLIYIVGEDPGPSLVITVLAFGLMLPLGMLLDRWRYRRQMRKWEERRAARPTGR